LVLPELDEIFETRNAMPFGVPLELIGARLGMIHGNRSTMREARAGFWDETLSPLYVMLASALTNGLLDDFDGWDYLEFDTSTVKALQEDADAMHSRVREDMLAGILTREEARQEIGKDPDVPDDATWMLGRGVTEVPAGTLPPEPMPPKVGTPAAQALAADQAAAGQPPEGAPAAKTTPRPVTITPADVVRAKAWIADLDDPELNAVLGIKRNGHS